MTKEEKVKLVIERLEPVYKGARIALDFTNPLELLVATIMSAQTLDKLVNQLTPALFAKYKTAKDYANADLDELAGMMSKVNFAFNKAKNIIAACKIIDEQYNGVVPKTMEELDALPGVARKTANVVLSNAYGIDEGIVIDTHMLRMSKRLGLTDHTDPVKVEHDLMKIVPKDKWHSFAHMLILHGREVCTARAHTCENCPLGDICPDRKT